MSGGAEPLGQRQVYFSVDCNRGRGVSNGSFSRRVEGLKEQIDGLKVSLEGERY